MGFPKNWAVDTLAVTVNGVLMGIPLIFTYPKYGWPVFIWIPLVWIAAYWLFPYQGDE